MNNLPDVSKAAAVLFLYGVGFIFACVIAWQIIAGVPTPNALAVGVVNIIIGYVINSVGVQHGVAVTNDTVAKTAVAQYPLVKESLATAASVATAHDALPSTQQ